MYDLKVMTLQKMSSVLGENSWNPFSADLEPEITMELLKTVYDNTRDDRRWMSLGRNEDGRYEGSNTPYVDPPPVQREDDLYSMDVLQRTQPSRWGSWLSWATQPLSSRDGGANDV